MAGPLYSYVPPGGPEIPSKLTSNFSESYRKSIEVHASRFFVDVYSKEDSVQRKTYSEFNQDVVNVRNYLLKTYSASEALATDCGNSYEHLVYIMAILTGGFTFCPLNPKDPENRKKEKLKLLGPATAHLSNLVLHKTAEKDLPARTRSPQQSFISVFTSGSTGYSKIVEQTEAGVLANIEAVIRHHEIGTNTVIGTPLPVFHVNALEFSFFGSFFAGAHLVLFEEFNLFQVFKALEEQKIQIFSAVPHILKTIADQGKKLKRLSLPHFKYFMTAAAPLGKGLTKTLTQDLGYKLIQGYGLSEAVNFSLTMPIHLNPDEYSRWYLHWERPSVGIPVFGNNVFILKEDLSICQEGEVGEVCIRGLNIMTGYREQDMSQVFRGDYLHTGDLGFFQVDPKSGKSFFFISGRIKDVCKRAAMTVSLVEVDDLIQRACPSGVDAVSFSFENSYVGEEIALATNTTDKNILDTIVSYCKSQISEEMRPRYIVSTAQALRTESGKPLRWKLKTLLTSESETLAGNSVTVKFL